MSALLTINVPLQDVMITVRFDGSKHDGVYLKYRAPHPTGHEFDVKKAEPGEPESVVISRRGEGADEE